MPDRGGCPHPEARRIILEEKQATLELSAPLGVELLRRPSRMRRINEAAGRAGAAIRDLQPRRGDSPFAASRPSPTRRHSTGSQRHSGYSASKEGKESPASSRPSKPTLSYHGPFAAELLPAASAAAISRARSSV